MNSREQPLGTAEQSGHAPEVIERETVCTRDTGELPGRDEILATLWQVQAAADGCVYMLAAG